MTYRTFVEIAAEHLLPLYPEREARNIASIVLSHYLKIPEYSYVTDGDRNIPDDLLESMQDAVGQLMDARPLQYVLGYTDFDNLKIRVKEGVLIPRPETEEMVRLIVDECSDIELDEDADFNILDMCTGSGCIAYALSSEFPSAQLYACDKSNDALTIACKQRIKLDGCHPVIFWADVLSDPPAGLPKFNIIVSNPPYVCEQERSGMRRNVLEYEPQEALFVPDDDPMLFYRAIRRWCDAMLVDGGRCYMEINERFGADVAAIFDGAEVKKDINGKDRFVRFVK